MKKKKNSLTGKPFSLTKSNLKKQIIGMEKELAMLKKHLNDHYVPKTDLFRVYAGMRIAIVDTLGQEEYDKIKDNFQDLTVEQIFSIIDQTEHDHLEALIHRLNMKYIYQKAAKSPLLQKPVSEAVIDNSE